MCSARTSVVAVIVLLNIAQYTAASGTDNGVSCFLRDIFFLNNHNVARTTLFISCRHIDANIYFFAGSFNCTQQLNTVPWATTYKERRPSLFLVHLLEEFRI